MKQFISLILSISLSLLSMAQSSSIKISGKLKYLKTGDSITLYVIKYGTFYKDNPIRTTFYSKAINNEFYFHIPVNGFKHPQYVIMKLPDETYKDPIYFYVVEPGDCISLTDSKGVINFYGKGSEKWVIQRYLEKLQVEYLKRNPPFNESTFHTHLELNDSFCLKSIAYLNLKKHLLSKDVFNLLKSDYFSSNEFQNAYEFNLMYGYGRLHVDSAVMNSYTNAMAQYQNNAFSILSSECFENKDILPYSKYYAEYLIEKYIYDTCYSLNRPFNLKNCYTYFKEHYSGLLRERIVTSLICKNLKFNGDLSYCVGDALKYIQNVYLKGPLNKIKGSRTKGVDAFNFSLPGLNDRWTKLSDLKGKIVLLDFWFTGCGNCIKTHPYIDSIATLYQGQDLAIVSISNDNEKETWIKSVNGGKYTSAKNINLYTDNKGENHPVIKNYFIEAYPTFVLIDRNGKLMENPVDPRIDKGVSLVNLINQELLRKEY